ncbi:cytochrome P450 4V2 [Trichonephila inaurata madagascariensis]|uniref:Cytochrome P450 4V2 n=1 Tax=Trichonephila inaurata madagascariensis TaxID=2747483 RepID=A0A8X6WPA1_9ARAC|nr:cytochrome P450 4V2 [Trichonephila inaurata madagascariensis]
MVKSRLTSRHVSLGHRDAQSPHGGVMMGHDTTATSMTWTLFLIGLHPNVQSKIHEELDFVFGDDIDRPVTMDDFKDLKYLECVYKASFPFLLQNTLSYTNYKT